MIGQDGQGLVPLVAGDAENQIAHRLGRTAKPVHDLNRKIVGTLLRFARIGRSDERARGENQRARPGDVAWPSRIRRLNIQSPNALASITSPPSSTDNGVAPRRSNH